MNLERQLIRQGPMIKISRITNKGARKGDNHESQDQVPSPESHPFVALSLRILPFSRVLVFFQIC
jgi:hypothetical protein